MKTILMIVFVFAVFVLQAQNVPVQQPIEEQYHISYWWWVLGVLIAIGIGIAIYMLIKKDPRRDVVR